MDYILGRYFIKLAFSKLDEITSARRQRINRIRRKRFTIFLVITLCLVLIYLVVTSYSEVSTSDAKDILKTTFASGSYPVDIEENVRMIDDLKSSIALLSSSKLITLKGSGSVIFSTYHGLTNAELASQSNRIIVYSQSGKSYKVYNRSQLLNTGNTEFEIAGAAVLPSARYCILTRGDEFTSELHVFNKDTSKRFTWYGTDGFPLDVISSKSGDNVIVISLKALEGRIITVVTMIDTSSQKEVVTFSVDGLLVDAVLDGDMTTLILDSEALLIDSKGMIIEKFSYDGKQLLKVAHQEGSNLILCFGDNMRSEINSFTILNKKLHSSGSVNFHKEIHGVWADSDEVFILSRGEVHVFSMQGASKRIYKCGTSAYGIFEWGGPVVLESRYAVKLTESFAPGQNG